ncbi:MAG: lysine--tRNA ligase [Dehalococcoidia bacterium]
MVQERIQKLQNLRDQGIDPYPAKYQRTHSTKDAKALLETIELNGEDPKTSSAENVISIAGRILAMRSMGRATFIDIQDGDGKIQTMFRSNALGSLYDMLRDLDIGDWIGIEGSPIRTRTGEATVLANSFTVVCKSLRSLPEKWHGLTNVESRYRQRYLDLISNEDSKINAITRSKIIDQIRRFMIDQRNYIEVETPILVPTAAGASARPFATYHNSLDRDLFLRIATELHLKRLVVGGLEKVFEIGKIFRNEGIDLNHNPEFTSMESYEAFTDYNDMMNLVEDIFESVSLSVKGTSKILFRETEFDLSEPWPKLNLRDEIIRTSGIDFLEFPSADSLRHEVLNLGIQVSERLNSWGSILDKLISAVVEPNLLRPTFLVDYPIEMSPLAKKHPDNPKIVERFEGFIGGMEVCNAFSELNDPLDQRERFEQQELLHKEYNDEETDRLDEDFLIAMEHGMPPTGGLGLGIDRLVMVLTGNTSIREIVLFPQLRS